ncbi:hypothetical protein [Pseudomonas sp. PP3]|uniref:hypothetical protein n=1 Tax=Pseudomonas sp. PP3 TaxID=2815936 RepID=UPI001BB05C95|nr:hypothetical protein [Pseudomonas sp. PP3]
MFRNTAKTENISLKNKVAELETYNTFLECRNMVAILDDAGRIKESNQAFKDFVEFHLTGHPPSILNLARQAASETSASTPHLKIEGYQTTISLPRPHGDSRWIHATLIDTPADQAVTITYSWVEKSLIKLKNAPKPLVIYRHY